MNNKDFYYNMLKIAVPVALQNLIMSSLNMLDTLMISSLGKEAIAGVGLANQIFFFYILICFGINTGASVITAQYWGKRDAVSVRKVNGLASVLCILFGLIFTIVAGVFPTFTMSLLTNDISVIEAGSRYLQVVSLSYIMTSVSGAYGTSLRSTGQPNPSLFGSIVGFVLNAFFNYVFIFGALGFPTLGIVGAAWGTVIARLVEFIIVIGFTHRYRGPLNASIKEMISFDKIFVMNSLAIMMPVIINEGFWSLGQVLYNVAYAMTGTESTAAIQVTVSIQNMMFVITRGLGSSCAIMIGNAIGQGKLDIVYDMAIKFVKITITVGLLLGGFVFIMNRQLLFIYGTLTPDVFEISTQLLKIMGIVYAIKAFNSVMVVGVLRGGGDTRFSMYMECSTVWLVGVPMAFIGAKLLNLPVTGVLMLVLMDDVVKAIIGFWRLRSKRWIKSVT